MSKRHVQTKREIEALLARAGLAPKHRFGQHFLIDGNLMRALVRSAEISQADTVLEVGAGTGGLTDLLAAEAGRVVAVELDRDLFPLLQERFAGMEHVTLIQGDILESKHRIRSEVARILAESEDAEEGVKLVANLPYQVATPLVMNLLTDYPAVRRLCFTVQAEVGERFAAQPGGKNYGPLAVVNQLVGRMETLVRIGPASFWPRPAVDSVMARLERLAASPLEGAALRRFADLVRGVFEHRRKTLRAALGYVVAPPICEQICAVWDGRRRAETIAVSEWLDMFRRIEASTAESVKPLSIEAEAAPFDREC